MVRDRVIVDNPAVGRFELVLDGHLSGVVEYRLSSDRPEITIPHVEVLPDLRGKGYSAPFLDDVLELVRARGLKVVPLCGYAAGHFRRRPDLHDLLAR